MNDLSPKSFFPALLSYTKLQDMFISVQKASIPDKFTFRFFSELGFASSNDRGFLKVLSFLGFLSDDNSPTSSYSLLRDPATFKDVLSSRILVSYKEVFAINNAFYNLDFISQKGIFSRLTGHDEKGVIAITKTFNALYALSFNNTEITRDVKRDSSVSKSVPDSKMNSSNGSSSSLPSSINTTSNSPALSSGSNIALNITINLPATNDAAVYDAIFKSIKDNLK